MAKKLIPISRFYGGITNRKKEAGRGSYIFGRSIDVRSDESSFTILPKTAKESGTTVVDLVKWFEPVGTDLYSYGDAGKLYKRTSAGAWSVLRTVSNSHGNGLAYFPEDDYLYYALDKVIGRYGLIAGTPAFNDDFFSDNTFDLDQSNTQTGQTYSLTNAINEGATHKQTFVPTRDPQKAFSVNISAKATGNWTVTIHDPSNTSVASLQIANASLAAAGEQKFTFSSVWRPVIGVTYHAHIVSSDGTGTVVTGTAADFETSWFKSYYQVLVEDTAFHPMAVHLGQLCVGNERYIATWDGIVGGGTTNYNANKLELPSGFKVRDLGSTGSYLAILAVRSNTVTDFEDAIIFLWDGISATFNDYIPINEGTATALAVTENRIYWITDRGWIYMFNGQVSKLVKVPLLNDKQYIDVFPGAMGVWKGLLRLGIAAATDAALFNHGVYSWGSMDIDFPEVLTYDYPISTGNRTGTGKKIGAVGARGNTFFVSWYDDAAGGSYGVDKVTTSADPFTSAEYQSMIIDDRQAWKEKGVPVIVISHKPLNANEGVQIGYDVNQTGSFTTGDVNSTANDTETRLPLDGRWRDLQIQVLLTTTVATAPAVTSIAIEFDDMIDEEITGVGDI